jgi:hypothetical protein
MALGCFLQEGVKVDPHRMLVKVPKEGDPLVDRKFHILKPEMAELARL